MSTPRKPGERGDGGTPGQKPGESKGPKESGASQPQRPAGGKPAGGAPAAGTAPDAQRPPAQTPPWQRGQQQQQAQQPKQQPPGAGRAAGPTGGGKPPAGPGKPGENGAAAKPPRPSRPVITGTAAPKPPTGAQAGGAGGAGKGKAQPGAAAADRKAAAQSKAAVIDGPTRTIDRSDLAKDMPDLSAVKHPSPAGGAATPAPAPTGALRKAAAALTASAPAEGEGLRATVQLRRIDPWSTLKVSLVISIALFFVWMVAIGLLYVVLDGMGVWDRLNNAFTEIVTDSSSGGLVTSGQVFGYSALVGVMNVVLFTALATIGSFIYNLCSDLVGGVQVTLADPD